MATELPSPSARTDPQGAPQDAFLNRELSWLEFNSRVLSLAEDEVRPLLERLKFLAITSQNLDEFFQIRVAGLKEQLRLRAGTRSVDGRTPIDQLREIRGQVETQAGRAIGVLNQDLLPSLRESGIRFVDWDGLSEEDRGYLEADFAERIFPVLTPLAVDPAHPFPYISNLSLNLAVTVRDPSTGIPRFARVKVPPLLARFVPLPGGEAFVPLEEVIAGRLDHLFPGMQILAHHPFRVTRNADLEVEEEEAADLLAAIEEELRRRRRFAQVVRLEVDRTMPEEIRELLVRELSLEPADVYVTDGLLDLGGMWELYALDRPELKDEPWKPATQPRLAPTSEGTHPDIFEVIRSGDVLVHHPYDSFATSVEAFVSQAAADPQVLAIKQTLYRTSGQESPIVRALIHAAETGKQVAALVELKARFDEQANIAWARALEEAGVHVVYGLVGLKTHAKISLVVRNEGGEIRRYAHVGTGNYNPTTATIYEDVGILSADPDLGADLTDLFNYLTGYSRKQSYRRLLVSPNGLRDSILHMIREEAAKPAGRITIKVNNLVDPKTIEALYEASRAGTEIDLICRSICCLRPGVPGLSDRIRVRGAVGRFLEHARIFRFGREDARFFIGSADLMPRNLDRRVEALVPVEDPALRARLGEVLEINLSDDLLAWELGPDGSWRRASRVRGINGQEMLRDLAVQRMLGEASSGA